MIAIQTWFIRYLAAVSLLLTSHRTKFDRVDAALFRYHIADQLSPDAQCTLYVDDFMISVFVRNEPHCSRVIGTSTSKLVEWIKSEGMKFSNEMTVVLVFVKWKTGDYPQFMLHNSNFFVRKSTLYLGLVIDEKLQTYVDHLRAKCFPFVNLIRQLSHLL